MQSGSSAGHYERDEEYEPGPGDEHESGEEDDEDYDYDLASDVESCGSALEELNVVDLHDSLEAEDDVESESDGDEGEGGEREEDAMQVVCVGEEAVDEVDEVASENGMASESDTEPREASIVS